MNNYEICGRTHKSINMGEIPLRLNDDSAYAQDKDLAFWKCHLVMKQNLVIVLHIERKYCFSC